MLLLPVQIGVIHPQTGEETLSRQTSEGGYVAVRKDATTPVTQLHLHQLNGFSSAQFELTWTSTKLKIWKDSARTQPVTSGSTTFPANQDTTLYLEGVTKSTTAKDVEVDETVIIGSQVSLLMPVKLTVVQSEFLVTLEAFIPYLWVDVPGSWLPGWVPGGNMVSGQVAVGDNRTYDPLLRSFSTFRAQEQFKITPFDDLSPQITTGLVAPPGESIHYDKASSVPASDQSLSHGYTFTANPQIVTSGAGTYTGPSIFNAQEFAPKKWSFQTSLSAYEGVLGSLAAPITWNLTIGIDVSNPVTPRAILAGSRCGFPAYEMYIQNSSGTNLPLYQWTPPTDRTVFSLLNTEDIPVAPPIDVP